MKLAHRALLFGLFLLAGIGSAFAQSQLTVCCAAINTTGSIPAGTTVSVPKFNPALGTLTSASFTATVSLLETATWTNTSSNTQDITVNYKASMTLSGPGSVILAPTNTVSILHSAVPPQGSFTDTNVNVTKSGVQTVTSSTTLLNTFTGTGNLSYSVSGSASFTNSTGGNLIGTLNTQYQALVTVVYTYTPAPALKIGDFVWNDLNGNGIQDSGEPGMPNVKLTITGTDLAGHTVNTSVVTDANGAYQFGGLVAGTYTVTVDTTTLPAGYKASPTLQGADRTVDSNANPSSTTITTLNDLTLDFAYYQPQGAIGDYVWQDSNRNGIQDANEVGIDGVTVKLASDSACSNVLATTVTALNGVAHGYYQFKNLSAGTYYVCVPAGPANWFATQTGQGTAVTDSNPNPAQVVLATDFSTDETIDFGFYPPGTAAIGDFVWSDGNHNGIQDSGELGIGNVTVNLSQNSDCSSPIATTTTDPTGAYHFTGLFGGTYYVCASTPTGYSPSTVNATSADKDSNGSPTQVILPDNTVDNTIDFGFVPAATGAIGDFVWYDTNRNGIQDPGEPGLNNVKVTLIPSQGASQTTTTMTNGYYQFHGLQADTYTVVIDTTTVPSGYFLTPANAGGDTTIDSNGVAGTNVATATVTLPTNSSTDQTIDFGFQSPCIGKIGDFVWNDANGNGIQDAGELGIAGVTVNLRKSDNTLITFTTTDGSGAYSFGGLCPATYLVEAVTPAGFIASPTGAGTTATDSNSTPSTVNLANDATDNTIDFGFYQLGSIGDRVWLDANGDGSQVGESGLVGWTVQITGPNSYSKTMTTGTDGIYSFTGLYAGSYTVCVTAQAGYSETYDLDGLGTANCATVNLAAGQNRTDVDFGYQQPPSISCVATAAGEVGVAFSAPAPSITGGTPPYNFSVATGTLPAGLTLNAVTGAITGTPTAAGTFTIKMVDANGNTAAGTCPYTINPAPSLTCATVTAGTVGAPFSAPALTVTNGTAPFTFAVDTGTLPAGLTLDATTGAITGTPTAAGQFTIKVTDAKGASASGNCPYTINVAPSLTCATVTAGTVGAVFNGPALNATGGTAPLTYSVATGTLPAGLTLNASTGAITGTPTAAGQFTLKVTDANGISASGNCPYTVNAAPSLTCATVSAGTVGTAFTAPALNATGGTAPLTYSVATGTLPAGLTLDANTGAITGTPTAAGQFTLKVTDANGISASGNCPYTVNAPPSLTCATVSAGTVGAAFTAPALNATGGTAPLTYSVATGTLPAGLTLDATTGAITGTPTAAGQFTIKVTDANGISASGNCPYTVNAPPSLPCPTVTSGTAGAVFTTPALNATGGTAPYTYSVGTGTLPAGLTLNPSTGAITGTPTAAGQFTVKVTDANGVSATAACPYTVNAAPALACVTAPAGEVGAAFNVAAPSVTGGTAPFTYSVATGAVPAGVTLNADGSISGTPTATGLFTIKVTDANGIVSTGNCPYSVGAAPSLACVSAPAGEVGAAFNVAAPSVTGGVGPFTYSVATGVLPAGVTLNADGSISGLPTGTGSFTIKVTDSKGLSSTGNCPYTVGSAPLLACVSAPAGEVGVAFNVAAPSVTGGIGTLTFSVATGALPAGVSLNPATGAISGTPTTTGSFTIKVTDSNGLSSTGNCPYSVGSAPLLACVSAPAGEVGVAFNVAAPSVTGGIGTLTFSVATGALPAGVSLNPATGAISGTPTTTGSFTIKVTDSNGLSSTGNCPYTVGAAPLLACVSAPAGEVGVAFNVAAPSVTGGIGTLTFSVATGALPAGVSLNPATGAISGTPTTTGSFTIKVTDSNGLSSTGNCPYTVGAGPLLACVSAPAGEVGVAFNVAAPSVTGGIGTLTFSVATGALPAGVSLNPATGAISGTPTTTGSFTIKVTDSNGLSSTGNCPYTVGAGPSLACVAATTGQAGLPYSAAAPNVTGGTSPYTFTIATGTMPSGLTLNPSTGAISGTPTSAGTWTIQVTDAKGITAAGTCAYTVTAAPTTTPIAHGDAATIGFWHNKNGQALILSMNGSASAKNLATWLATSFPNLYGATSTHNLTGKTNTDVAALFMTFFNVKGTNTDAQVMGGALAIYVTNPSLAGSSVAAGYGFNISPTGTGAKTYNTGSNGTAIGLSNNTSYTVTQLMQAANAVAPYSTAAFNALNTIFDGINTTGDII